VHRKSEELTLISSSQKALPSTLALCGHGM